MDSMDKDNETRLSKENGKSNTLLFINTAIISHSWKFSRSFQIPLEHDRSLHRKTIFKLQLSFNISTKTLRTLYDYCFYDVQVFCNNFSENNRWDLEQNKANVENRITSIIYQGLVYVSVLYTGVQLKY